MATSYHTFLSELYEEHVEEAAFLYEHLFALIEDEEISWQDLHEFEQRFEAHLDALVIGDTHAKAVALEMAEGGEGAERHVYVRLLCRHNLCQEFLSFLKNSEFEEAAETLAYSKALLNEAPETWAKSLQEQLSNLSELHRFAILPFLAKSNALDTSISLAFLDQVNDNATLTHLLQHISTGATQFNRDLLAKLSMEKSAEKSAAFVQHLIEHQQVDPSYYATYSDHLHSAALPWLACASTPDLTPTLIQKFSSQPTASLCLAAGIHGSLETVPLLVAQLSNEETSTAAAYALFTITGAPLYTEQTQEESYDEDELFPVELEKFKQGEKPKNAEGKPFSVTSIGLSQNPADWTQWFQQNQQNMDRTKRYRFGKPATARTTISGLRAPLAYHPLRVYFAYELLVRYAAIPRFEPSAEVPKQMSQLAALQNWNTKTEAHFTPGAWYRFGQCCGDAT